VAQILNDHQFDIVERLAHELRAIDQWDIGYWRKRRREAYERAAYSSRKKRRGEIMRALQQPHVRLLALAESQGTNTCG
jgi:hypothetical protein